MTSTDPLLQKMSALLQREGVLPIRRKSLHILVAFSGGADSTALLLGLHLLRAKAKLRLSALYVNHGLRPASVLKTEEAGCLRLCKRLEIPFYMKSADVWAFSRQNKISLELAGRTTRYQLLQATAAVVDADLIATGHHQDDQLETILFRLLRGGWLDSLAGIPFRRENIIRPLLQCSKAEILTFLKRHRLRYSTDATNDDRQFARNRIRHDLLPLLRQSYPHLDESLLSVSRQASEVGSFFSDLGEDFLAEHSTRTPGGKLLVDRQRFTSLSPIVRAYVLRKGISHTSESFQPVALGLASELETLPTGTKVGVNLPGGGSLRSLNWPQSPSGVADLLAIIPASRPMAAATLPEPKKARQSIPLFEGEAELVYRESNKREFSSDPLQVTIDREKINFPLTVRVWKSGDRFVPLGMTGRKKVGDYLTDKKVPEILRDEQLVVEDRDGIIWLIGQTISGRVKVTPESRRFLSLSYHRVRGTA